jgi:hypothetical protein
VDRMAAGTNSLMTWHKAAEPTSSAVSHGR